MTSERLRTIIGAYYPEFENQTVALRGDRHSELCSEDLQIGPDRFYMVGLKSVELGSGSEYPLCLSVVVM